MKDIVKSDSMKDVDGLDRTKEIEGFVVKAYLLRQG